MHEPSDGKIYRIRSTSRRSASFTSTAARHHGHLWIRLEGTADKDNLSLYKSIATGSRHAFYTYEMEEAEA